MASNYRLLGRSGLRVSPICLGTMNFGTNWDFMGTTSQEECEKIFDSYVSNGGNFIDTANKYHEGQSEEWLGEWIEKRGIRDDLVIATKYSLPMKEGSINLSGNHRRNLFLSVESSLKRLRTSYIDILYVHFWDFTTPYDEIMRSLNDIVSTGKVHYIGVSDTPAWRVAQMNEYAKQKGFAQFVCYQGRYHFGERDLERDIEPLSKAMGLTIVPWGVLGQGKYTGRFDVESKESKIEDGRQTVSMTEKDYEILKVVQELSKELNATPSQICLAFALSKGYLPIIGCRKISHLEDNLKSLNLNLTQGQIEKLNSVTDLYLGFPYNFIGVDVNTNQWLYDAGFIDTTYQHNY